MSNLFYLAWQRNAQALSARAERLSKNIVDEARRVAAAAGCDPSAPFQSAHNWEGLPGINDSLRRKVLYLERLSWEPGRIVSRINARSWERIKGGF